MAQPPSMVSGRLRVVRAVYANLNRGDTAAAVRDFTPDARFIELPGRPGGRDCHGRAEMAAYFATARARWAEGRCEPVRFLATADRLVVLAHVHVRLQGASEWLDGHVGDVFSFEGDRMTAFHSFDAFAQALSFAGLDPDTAETAEIPAEIPAETAEIPREIPPAAQ